MGHEFQMVDMFLQRYRLQYYSNIGHPSFSRKPLERSAFMVATGDPIHNTKEQHFKILHLVRHAQGIHNVAGQKDHSALSSFKFFDAQLSPHGLNQAKDLREKLHELGSLKRIELVVTSPLSRSVQTAVELFDHVSQSEETNAEEAVGGCKCPPFVAVELCRECVGVHPCDKRRSVTELRNLFPSVDFSLIETEDDVMWKADVRETKEEVAARGFKFMNWLWARPEKEIAIVAHHRFLEHTLNGLRHSIDPSIRTELCKAFKNCELRSVAMVGKREEYLASDATDELTDTAEKLSGGDSQLLGGDSDANPSVSLPPTGSMTQARRKDLQAKLSQLIHKNLRCETLIEEAMLCEKNPRLVTCLVAKTDPGVMTLKTEASRNE